MILFCKGGGYIYKGMLEILCKYDVGGDICLFLVRVGYNGLLWGVLFQCDVR